MILNKAKRKEVCAGYVTELTQADVEPPSTWPPKRGAKYVIGWRNKEGKKMGNLGQMECLAYDKASGAALVKIADEYRLLARRSEYSYTEGPMPAPLDEEPEAVDEQTQREFTTQSRARFAEHRGGIAEIERTRQQERAVREQLKGTVRELGPTAGQNLLAGVQRLIAESTEEAA